MRVSALARAINAAELVAEAGQSIAGITNDSRSVTPGSLYAALRGDHVDGHTFIADAVRSGASAVLCSTVPAPLPRGVAVLLAANARLALSEISDVFNGGPSDLLDVIGVTGTDGKTTTVSFIHQLLGMMGEKSSYLSTAAMAIAATEEPNRLHQSTPEAPVVHATLRAMADSGSRYAVLESTSHGLSARTCRLAHVAYRAAVFTNISHEHLEFHGTYERYRADKANLFRALENGRLAHAPGFAGQADTASAPTGADLPTTGNRIRTAWDEVFDVTRKARFGVVNLASPEAAFMASMTSRPVAGYSVVHEGTIGESGAMTAVDLRTTATETDFILKYGGKRAACRLSVPGHFNVENAVAALLAVSLTTGVEPGDLASRLPELTPVAGRMSVVGSEPFAVVVDYAHTPGSFERVLPFFRAHTSGKLVVVFGSAGERDVAKRPIQGRIADEYADIIILADEDPRGEAPVSILDDIASGCPRRRPGEDLFKIPDRREAIRKAFTMARPGDTVLLLGKGHEASIIGADGPAAWDETTVAGEELSKLGGR